MAWCWPPWSYLCQACWVEFSLNFHRLFSWNPGPLQSRAVAVASSPVHVAPFPWTGPCWSLCWEVLGEEGMATLVWGARMSIVAAGLLVLIRFHQGFTVMWLKGKKPQHLSPKPSLSLPSTSLSEQEVAFLSALFCSLTIGLRKLSFICYCFDRVWVFVENKTWK